MKFKIESKFCYTKHLTVDELQSLIELNITNTDKRDDGSQPSSKFKNHIENLQWGIEESYLLRRVYLGSKLIGWCALYRPKINSICYMTYILPAYRRKGLGTKLFLKAAKKAKKLGYANLEATPWSKTSEKFYSSLGCETSFNYSKYSPGITKYRL